MTFNASIHKLPFDRHYITLCMSGTFSTGSYSLCPQLGAIIDDCTYLAPWPSDSVIVDTALHCIESETELLLLIDWTIKQFLWSTPRINNVWKTWTIAYVVVESRADRERWKANSAKATFWLSLWSGKAVSSWYCRHRTCSSYHFSDTHAALM